ncbi:MAG: transposase, partial [Cyclobacteriaceae bacterium]|nr:transposase [Cyclobacteriaceae bacterium]
MNLLKFHQVFTNEEACKLHFKQVRDKNGVVCNKCGSEHHYWISSMWMYECKECHYRTSLKKGTIMENSKLKFKTWYIIMLFMSATKKGFSAAEVQR